MKTTADKKFWLLVGREFSKGSVKYLYLLSSDRERRRMPYEQFWVFAKGNAVLNAQPSDGSLRGIGIDLNRLPRYKRSKTGVVQCGGLSEALIVRQAQPQIRLYLNSDTSCPTYRPNLQASPEPREEYASQEYRKGVQRPASTETGAEASTMALLFPDEEVTYWVGRQ